MNNPETITAPIPSALALPELQNALLDRATVTELLRDIETCTEVTEVIPKNLARGCVGERTLSLAEARQQLLGGQLRGLQIRYRYQDADWWDTLLCAEGQFRLVRIRHDFAALDARRD